MTEQSGSFEHAFDHLFAAAMRTANRILGDSAAAEDVAAEALARACVRWRKIENLPYRDAWVLRVAANLAIDVTRRRRPQLQLEHVPGHEEESLLRIALVGALQKLPLRQREVIVLRYLSGLREDEIAASLGLSAGTVKSHARRALAALRRRLGEDFNEEVAFGPAVR